MQKTARSLGFAISGLVHAIRTERNLQLFVLAHILIIAAGMLLRFNVFEWLLVGFFGGFFVTAELLNTAIERLADTVDDLEKQRQTGHYHHGIKYTKDIGAAASLIALIIDIVLLALLFTPRLLLLALQTG